MMAQGCGRWGLLTPKIVACAKGLATPASAPMPEHLNGYSCEPPTCPQWRHSVYDCQLVTTIISPPNGGIPIVWGKPRLSKIIQIAATPLVIVWLRYQSETITVVKENWKDLWILFLSKNWATKLWSQSACWTLAVLLMTVFAKLAVKPLSSGSKIEFRCPVNSSISDGHFAVKSLLAPESKGFAMLKVYRP